MKLRENLKEIIAAKGMTAAQLSRKSGVPKQVLSDWLAGTKPRSIEHLKKVADALEVSVDELCFGKNATAQLTKNADIDALLGDGWLSGLFEVRLRKVKR